MSSVRFEVQVYFLPTEGRDHRTHMTAHSTIRPASTALPKSLTLELAPTTGGRAWGDDDGDDDGVGADVSLP